MDESEDIFVESLKKLAEIFKDDEPILNEWLDLKKLENKEE